MDTQRRKRKDTVYLEGSGCDGGGLWAGIVVAWRVGAVAMFSDLRSLYVRERLRASRILPTEHA